MQKTDSADLLFRRIEDAAAISQNRPHYIGFLNEAECDTAKSYLKNRIDVNYSFYGGYEDAERCMLGFFPEYLEASAKDFPIEAITFSFRQEDSLSHRDFLGSFMALGIERSAVGDILVEAGKCVAFIRREMLSYFTDEIRKVGRVGVKLKNGYKLPLPDAREYKELSGVVASERVDCIVALLSKQSREKAANMIKSGLVQLNHVEISSTSLKVNVGDKLSIRTKGKFIIDEYGKLTGKGRLPVSARKYI